MVETNIIFSTESLYNDMKKDSNIRNFSILKCENSWNTTFQCYKMFPDVLKLNPMGKSQM